MKFPENYEGDTTGVEIALWRCERREEVEGDEMSNKQQNYIVEYVRYDEATGIVRVNDELAFGGIYKTTWEYIENGCQIVMKYLVDRKKKCLTKEEIRDFLYLSDRITMERQGWERVLV